MVKSKKNLLLVILSVVFALTLISFVAVRPVKAETSAVTMSDKASVRLDTDGNNADGKNGLRFTAFVNESVALDEDTYAGIFVAKGELSVEEMKALTPKGDVIDVKAEKFDPARDDEVLGKAFNAVIYDVPDVALAQDLTAMAYVYDAVDGYTYSENVTTRSLVEVASASLVKDNNTQEDAKLLEEYVARANPVLKVGDTVLDSENPVTLQAGVGDKLTLTAEPACLAFKVTSMSDAIVVDGNTIKAVKEAESTGVVVSLGGVDYMFDVAVGPFTDSNRAENVIVDFDEEEYKEYAFEDGYGSIVFHPGNEGAAYGADSGVVRLTKADYNRLHVMFIEPINLKNETGLYLKIKASQATNLGNIQISFYADSKNFMTGKNGSTTAFEFNKLIGNVTHTQDWTVVRISAQYFADLLDITKDIYGIRIYTVNQSTEVILDEIGFMQPWTDTNLAEGVIADFDEQDYACNVSVTKTGDEVAILTDVEGANGGVVRMNAKAGWDGLKINFPDGVKFEKNKVLRIRMMANFNKFGQMTMVCYDKDGNKLNAQPTNPYFDGSATFDRLSAFIGYSANEWFDFYITGELLVSAFGENVATIEFNTNNVTGYLYIDEMSIEGPIVEDDTIAENVVADFDEVSYVKSSSLGEYTVYNVYDEWLASGVEGANGGVMYFKGTGAYAICNLGLAKEIDLSKVQSIEIKIKVASNTNQLQIGAYDTEGNRVLALASAFTSDSITNGEWVTLSLSASKFVSMFGEGVSLTRLCVYGGASVLGDIYVDQISVTPIA